MRCLVSHNSICKCYFQRIFFILILLIIIGFSKANASTSSLDGRWLGYLGCANQGFEDTFFLEISGSKATLTGSRIKPQHLNINIGSNLKFDADFIGWNPNFNRGPKAQINLSGKFLPGAKALYGEVDGWKTRCPGFVAVRAPQPASFLNKDGILYKIDPRDARTASNLTQSECRAYARWLASGEAMKLGKRPTQVNSAILDLNAMRNVLGRDIYSWEEFDGARIRIIGNACRIQLQGSTDNSDRILVKEIRGVWFPATLTARPSIQVTIWHLAHLLVHNELLLTLPLLRDQIEEGLHDEKVENSTDAEAPLAIPKNGFTGKWHGYYVCNKSEFYLQLEIKPAKTGLSATFSFGSSLTASLSRGSMSMNAEFPKKGKIVLKPHKWILQPRGILPIGFSGALSENRNRIEGRVEGAGEACQTFYATRRPDTVYRKKADGILFRITGGGTNKLNLDECRRYARWVGTNEWIKVGRAKVSSLVLNQDVMFEVLGKDVSSWGDDDHLKIREIVSQCSRQMRQSMNLDDLELVKSISDWAPYPFSLAKSENLHWLVAVQAPLLIAEAKVEADRQLDRITRLSFDVKSIRVVDKMLEDLEAGKGRLMFLDEEAKSDHRLRIAKARERLGVQVAETLSKKYFLFPQSLDGLDSLAEYHQTQAELLSELNTVQGKEKLNNLFDARVRSLASELWPALISEAHSALNKFKGKSFSYFPNIALHDKLVGRLEEYYVPASDVEIGKSYSSYLESRRDVVENMVEQSQKFLIDWIHSLPPSKTTQEKIEHLSRVVFDSPMIPERFAKLHAAASAKYRSYNAANWRRPDIGLAILRGHWVEVDHRGLESLAYITTLLRVLKEQCPGTLPTGSVSPGAASLMSYTASASADAMSRIKRGKIANAKEAQRTVFLFMNMIVNRPGCRMNYFGRVVGCVSQEQFLAGQEALMTSSEGLADGSLLTAEGCLAEGPGRFVKNLITYAELKPHSHRVPSMELMDAWDYVAQHE